VREIHVRVGDSLFLRVFDPRADQVTVRGFGEVQAVDRYGPAEFDLFADQRGTFAVRLLQADRTVGRIVVARR
jgi:hypothetical protein